FCCFFFQAEDGIRDRTVTGVQTCALPILGQLSHPSIITLHDMGIDEASHTPYLVMEYLEGQPLDRILDKRSIPFQKACAWAGQVASALGVAHRKGVIHGDVKPANMLITEDGRV